MCLNVISESKDHAFTVYHCEKLLDFFFFTSSRVYRKAVAEPRTDSCPPKLRRVLRMHQRTTVGKFAPLLNPSGQTFWLPFLTYLGILWQQGEKKTHPPKNQTKPNQQTQQPAFPETLRFLFQCTMDDEPQKFWQ